MAEELTQEQIELAKKRLAEMSPDELKKLMKEQCLFCNIVDGRIKASKIYEDSEFIAVLDINPATKGHTLVTTKEHYSILAEMDDAKIGKLFNVANNISKKLFQELKAEGSNIFLANGQVAEQNVPHVIVHVIPRYKDDNINFDWERKKIDETLLEELSRKLRIEDKIVKIVKKPKLIKKRDFDERQFLRIP